MMGIRICNTVLKANFIFENKNCVSWDTAGCSPGPLTALMDRCHLFATFADRWLPPHCIRGLMSTTALVDRCQPPLLRNVCRLGFVINLLGNESLYHHALQCVTHYVLCTKNLYTRNLCTVTARYRVFLSFIVFIIIVILTLKSMSRSGRKCAN